MYEPAEDSELLGTAVKERAEGKTLDLGTGSGYLAFIAHEKGCNVLAVDIDKSVLSKLSDSPFKTKYSDKFSTVKEKFDTIICNPPYLPADKEINDLALHGGKKGYEYIVSIIKQAKYFMKSDAQLLFLISTLTKPAVVEKTLLEEGYSWTIIAREKLFMEELLVYKATPAINEPAVLAGRGKRSLVYKTKHYAVKVSTKERAAKEAQLLKKVNDLGIGPRYIKHEANRLYMQYVDGEPFNGYLERTKDKMIMKKLLAQTRKLDVAGIKKQELSRPDKNVLVTRKKKVVLLDFERSIFTNKPNNVTQLVTYLAKLLGKDARSVLQKYKRSISETNYKAVERLLFS